MPIFTTLVNDSFAQADGPLEALNWSLINVTPSPNAQVISHICESTIVTKGSWLLRTGESGWISGGQFCEVAIHQLTGDVVNNRVLIAILTDINAAAGIASSAQPVAGGQISFQAADAVTGLPIGSLVTRMFVADAKYRIELFAGTLVQFYNGEEINRTPGLTSHLADSGKPSLVIEVSDVLANASVSNFTAGTIAGGESDFQFGLRPKF